MRKLFLAGLLVVMQLTAHTQTNISPIFKILTDPDLTKAKAIIEADPTAVNARVGLGVTPLQLIANAPIARITTNPLEIMRERINEADKTNVPIPLIAQLLVEKGADVNAKDDTGQTALMYALLQNKTSFACWLMDHGADINATNLGSVTPLYIACAKGEGSLAAILIGKGAEVNTPNTQGAPLLLWAIHYQMPEIVKLLIARGADVNALVDNDGEAQNHLLHAAVIDTDTNIVGQLLDAGAKVDVRNKNGQTPLYVAARLGAVDVVKLLLLRGADVNAKDSNGNTPLTVVRTKLDHFNPEKSKFIKNALKATLKLLKKNGGTEK